MEYSVMCWKIGQAIIPSVPIGLPLFFKFMTKIPFEAMKKFDTCPLFLLKVGLSHEIR
jgi:hypothetical protein